MCQVSLTHSAFGNVLLLFYDNAMVLYNICKCKPTSSHFNVHFIYFRPIANILDTQNFVMFLLLCAIRISTHLYIK